MKKKIVISFSVREICLLEIRGAISRQFGQLFLAQFSQNYLVYGGQMLLVAKSYILIFVIIILPPNNELFEIIKLEVHQPIWHF